MPDLFPGAGAQAGIHSGLQHSANPAIFAVASDMPYLNSDLIRHLAKRADEESVVIPEGPDGLESLHAVYGAGCLEAIESSLKQVEKRIVSFFPEVKVKKIRAEQVASLDDSFCSFININTPKEYFRLREDERGLATASGTAKYVSPAT